MGALTSLEVDRVDAVDRPATRRKFIITKAESDDPAKEVKRLLTAAVKSLTALRKAETMATFDETQAAALNELRDALEGEDGLPEAFAKAEAVAPAAPPAAPATTPPAAPATAPEVTPQVAPIDATALGTAIAGAMAEPLAKSIVAAIRKAVEDEDDDEVGTADTPPVAPPASAQPAGQTPLEKRGGREFGQGMFSNIVAGRGTNFGGSN